ncbi:MAG: hypothetical protein JOZ28_10045, partial [Candidatus Eremiobacteraeota bacterium]|nr:hypothetical protein [Candidatus Eremiobacteraeota bacterium]
MTRSIERNLIVGVLSLFVFCCTLPGLSFVWDEAGASWGVQGPLGFVTDYDGVIKIVAPNSVAATAGLQRGDRIDLPQTSFESRSFILPGGARMAAGQRVDLWLVHDNAERRVTLVAPSVPYSILARVSFVVRSLGTLVFVVVGGSLVILRP